ncbi:MAG: hypothetical protein IT564_08430 [Rhodospirillales bacterium]|nr:hypothetical protein [Rhodospirillales bacterium]
MVALARHGVVRPAAAVPPAREVGWILLMTLLVLAMPPAIFGALTYYRFGILDPSYYVPYEEFWAAMTSGDVAALFAAPLLSVNMTSGDILANMYSVTLGQYGLSIALGTAMGLAMAKQFQLLKACSAGTVGGTAAATGSGLFATVAASSTGILGCCGSGLAGGVLTLLGVGGGIAGQLAGVSLLFQIALIALFALLNLRFAARLKALAPHVAA